MNKDLTDVEWTAVFAAEKESTAKWNARTILAANVGSSVMIVVGDAILAGKVVDDGMAGPRVEATGISDANYRVRRPESDG